MMTRGAAMSPTMRPSLVISTDSVAVTLPTTTPAMMQFLTCTSALTWPVGSTTRVRVRVRVPSTRPRTVRSSSPAREPLMRIDSPMMVVPSWSPWSLPLRFLDVHVDVALEDAPSAMRMRGARMSPITLQSALSSTLSLAAMLPVTCPDTSTLAVSMSASMTPEAST